MSFTILFFSYVLFFLNIYADSKLEIGGHSLGGTRLYKHFRGAKGLFSYVSLQANNSFWGEDHAKFFILGIALLCPPAGMCLVIGTSKLIIGRDQWLTTP